MLNKELINSMYKVMISSLFERLFKDNKISNLEYSKLLNETNKLYF